MTAREFFATLLWVMNDMANDCLYTRIRFDEFKANTFKTETRRANARLPSDLGTGSTGPR